MLEGLQARRKAGPMSGSNAKRHRREGLGRMPILQSYRLGGRINQNAARNVTAGAGSSCERRHEKPLSRVVLQLERIPVGFFRNFNALSRQSPQM